MDLFLIFGLDLALAEAPFVLSAFSSDVKWLR